VRGTWLAAQRSGAELSDLLHILDDLDDLDDLDAS
jgi:hypothetical protein